MALEIPRVGFFKEAMVMELSDSGLEMGLVFLVSQAPPISMIIPGIMLREPMMEMLSNFLSMALLKALL
ncbi:hypothetical protein N9035_01170 [Akkermansiaceae bacterium]|nr:hypothetical protein [Akkermansiaceae bacterium]